MASRGGPIEPGHDAVRDERVNAWARWYYTSLVSKQVSDRVSRGEIW
jgi:hypothetical protein